MRVLMVTSEAVPFAKTGGLADVCGALPTALADLGHDVRVVMPRYRQIDAATLAPGLAPLGVPTGEGERWCGVPSRRLSSSGVSFTFIEHDALFGRSGLYGPSGGVDGYPDNCLRFTVLCRGALQLCHQLGWFPDVIHCHDWQASLVPWFLHAFEGASSLAATPTLLTVHNQAYQGRFAAEELLVTGLGRQHFDWRGLEHQGGLNLLKGGLARATLLNTVSPTYAQEIQTPELGEGLDGLLRYRAADLRGVLNGIDTALWDPATDPLLPARYDASSLTGKATCARELRWRAGLPEPSGSDGRAQLLAGFIGRLVLQKGADVIVDAADRLVAAGVQVVLLGTGDEAQESDLRALSSRLDGFHAWIDFDESLAHLIYAGCDLLLMPSRYEPCGLNQLYAMRYGTLPVVTDIGGLRDSVSDAGLPEGTGFVCASATTEDLIEAVARAQVMAANPPGLDGMIQRAMSRDSGWDRAAQQYVALYEEALERKKRDQ